MRGKFKWGIIVALLFSVLVLDGCKAAFKTEGSGDEAIDIAAIPGVTPPCCGQAPVASIAETAEYTGTITWSPADTPFSGSTVYTATITLVAKSGYTLNGVPKNFFTVVGASSVTNSANSGVVTAVFPATRGAGENGLSGALIVGAQGTVTAGTKTVKMIYANDQASITFPFTPTSWTITDSEKATLTRKFFLSETEVTTALYAAVLQWAKDNGKFVETAGAHNELNASEAKYGSRVLINLAAHWINYDPVTRAFSVTTGLEGFPVQRVSWYGAVMFCNWLTEMRDGNADSVVYSGIDETWDHMETMENADRTGYRLPSSEEWEYAARYIGKIPPAASNLSSEYIAQNLRTGHAALTAGYFWTPASYASGAMKDYTNEAETRVVACYSGDPLMGGSDCLMPVGQKSANQLGLRDMSGNAWEWVSTPSVYTSVTNRVFRGGSWFYNSAYQRIGVWGNEQDPSSISSDLGFRFARTR